MKSAMFIKLAIGAVLFLTWVALVVLKVPGTEDIIAFIKVGLGGLGIYHSLMTTPGTSGTTVAASSDFSAEVTPTSTTPLAPAIQQPTPLQ